MDEALSPRDRYARSIRARDLTSYATSRFAPADVVAAAGMAAQRRPLGMLLQRLVGDDRAGDRIAVEEMLERALRGAVRRNDVRRDGVEASHVVRDALAWWLDPNCLECTGVRFDRAAGSNRLSARPCKACGGTGLRPVASAAPDAARWVIDYLSQQVDLSEAAHRKRLR